MKQNLIIQTSLWLFVVKYITRYVKQTQALCPSSNWRYNNETQKCYLFEWNDKKDWKSADWDCKLEYGGILACVKDKATQDFLQKYLGSTETSFWIGGALKTG